LISLLKKKSSQYALVDKIIHPYANAFGEHIIIVGLSKYGELWVDDPRLASASYLPFCYFCVYSDSKAGKNMQSILGWLLPGIDGI